MRTTPALALVAAFLASSAVGVIASPQAHLTNISHKAHHKTCKLPGHHHRHGHHHKHADEILPASAPAPALAPAADAGNFPASDFASGANSTPSPQPWTALAKSGNPPQNDSSDKKMRKKKHKGKCALKPKGQGSPDQAQPPLNGGAQGGDLPPVIGAPGAGDVGSEGLSMPPASGGATTRGAPDQPGAGFPSDGSKPEGYGDEGSGYQPPPIQPGSEGQGAGTQPLVGSAGQGSAAQPGNNPPGSDGQGQGQGQGQSQDQGQGQEGYNPPNSPQETADGGPKQDDGKAIHCEGFRGSATPTNGKYQPHWFSPSLIHHGPGTPFGDGDNFWQGGACMFDDMPHHNLPSVAMDQSFFQDGLACGTCVEIASTSASLFSNDAKWSVETPKKGTLPPGKKTVAIVSDLCPGVDQCWSGLDMHPDAWNSVTNGADGSKLPINWKFVNCKEAFENSGSGLNQLQVHWRPGANPGFFQVQIRGNHEAVVKVEMKYGKNRWMEASHVDNAWWKFEDQSQAGFDQGKTKVTFRITDWQGQTITSEKGTSMGSDVFFKSNFEPVESYQA